ncbi:MAG: hypothetical protein U5Q44_14410 [Dehalococcoidia bacterium]|nr:hypothetical protein [Dehalococcoidia bacterium]
MVAALRALAPGGTVAINAIHLDEMPAFDYGLLWRERILRSVANFTRTDAREFMALSGEIPVQAAVRTFPLAEVNSALAGIRDGTLDATAVLDLRPGAKPSR